MPESEEELRKKVADYKGRLESLRVILEDLQNSHVHSWPSSASSIRGLCCERRRMIDEAILQTRV